VKKGEKHAETPKEDEDVLMTLKTKVLCYM
jgi:hypothetical protein